MPFSKLISGVANMSHDRVPVELGGYCIANSWDSVFLDDVTDESFMLIERCVIYFTETK